MRRRSLVDTHHGFFRNFLCFPLRLSAHPWKYTRLKHALFSKSSKYGLFHNWFSAGSSKPMRPPDSKALSKNWMAYWSKVSDSALLSFNFCLYFFPYIWMLRFCIGEWCVHVTDAHASAPGLESNWPIAWFTCTGSHKFKVDRLCLMHWMPTLLASSPIIDVSEHANSYNVRASDKPLMRLNLERSTLDSTKASSIVDATRLIMAASGCPGGMPALNDNVSGSIASASTVGSSTIASGRGVAGVGGIGVDGAIVSSGSHRCSWWLVHSWCFLRFTQHVKPCFASAVVCICFASALHLLRTCFAICSVEANQPRCTHLWGYGHQPTQRQLYLWDCPGRMHAPRHQGLTILNTHKQWKQKGMTQPLASVSTRSIFVMS